MIQQKKGGLPGLGAPELPDAFQRFPMILNDHGLQAFSQGRFHGGFVPGFGLYSLGQQTNPRLSFFGAGRPITLQQGADAVLIALIVIPNLLEVFDLPLVLEQQPVQFLEFPFDFLSDSNLLPLPYPFLLQIRSQVSDDFLFPIDFFGRFGREAIQVVQTFVQLVPFLLLSGQAKASIFSEFDQSQA